jgi:hypothetical protein
VVAEQQGHLQDAKTSRACSASMLCLYSSETPLNSVDLRKLQSHFAGLCKLTSFYTTASLVRSQANRQVQPAGAGRAAFRCFEPDVEWIEVSRFRFDRAQRVHAKRPPQSFLECRHVSGSPSRVHRG